MSRRFTIYWLGALAFLCTVSLAAPAAQAQGALDALEERLERAAAAPLAEPGAAEPGYVGLVADESSDARAGVLVVSVREGGPADSAGLRAGDQITGLDGRAVRSMDDLADLLGTKSVGDKVTFEIVRGGRRESALVTLANRPPEPAPTPETVGGLREPAPLPEPGAAARNRRVLGVNVTPVTDDARRRYGFTVRRGAVIALVYPGSPAERAGLPVGGVIVAIDGRRVDSPEDLVAYLRRVAGVNEVEINYYEGDRLLSRPARLDAAMAERDLADGPLPARPGRLPLAEDRPVLRRLEGLIDRIVPPSGGPVELSPDRFDRAESAEVAALKRHVELLERQVAELEKRLATAEAQLAEAKPDAP